MKNFGFSVLLSVVVSRFSPFLASGFRFFGKNNAVFRILVTDVDFGFPIWKDVEDKPARASNVVFVVVSHYQLPSSYNFALTSMSFLIQSEVPKIVFSRG